MMACREIIHLSERKRMDVLAALILTASSTASTAEEAPPTTRIRLPLASMSWDVSSEEYEFFLAGRNGSNDTVEMAIRVVIDNPTARVVFEDFIDPGVESRSLFKSISLP